MWRLFGTITTLFVLGVYAGLVLPVSENISSMQGEAGYTYPHLSSVTYSQIPTVNQTPTVASSVIESTQSYDARFAGMLLHIRWLIERGGNNRSEIERLDKQILSVMDDVSEDIDDLQEDINDITGLPGGFVIDNTGTVTAGVWQGTAIGDSYLTKTGDWTGTFDGIDGSAFALDADIDVTIQGYNANTSFLGNTISANELSSADFGDFTCNGTLCALDISYLTSLNIDTSAELVAIMGDETGSGALVFGTSPTLTTPNLGTPSAITLTSGTGLPISTGLTGAGTGVLTALGINIGTAGSFITNGGALGTPSSGTLTNATGLPISTGVSGLAANVATFLGTPSSANLISALTDETGTGRAVFSISPAFSGTPTFAALTATSTVTLSGTAANISLGSNFISGDGDDEGIYVGSTGNVGIGTTNPGVKLDVVGGSVFTVADDFFATALNGTTGNLRLHPYTTAHDASTIIAYSAAYAGFGSFAIEAANIKLFTAGLERARIDSSGNVGIGITTPNTILSVNAPGISVSDRNPVVTAQRLTTTLGGIYSVTETASPFGWGLAFDVYQTNVGQIEAVRIANNGNVGIGTTTPTTVLQLGGAATFSSVPNVDLIINSRAGQWGVIKVADHVAPTANNAMDLGSSTSAWRNGYFLGNVGIGTTTPATRLHVVADANSIGLRITADSSDGRGMDVAGTDYIGGTRGSSLRLSLGSPTGTTYSLINAATTGGTASGVLVLNGNGGNVGIGTTTPLQKLQVFGDIRVGTTGSNGCLENYGGGVIGGTCTSDERLKENIELLADSNPRSYLEAVSALKPVTYTWNEEAGTRYGKNTNIANLGFIAQDVEEVFPELISRNKDGFRQVDFGAFTFYLVEAVKELWEKVKGIDERVEDLEAENEYLKSRLDEIEDELNITPPPAPSPEPSSEPEPEPEVPSTETPDPEDPVEPTPEEVVEETDEETDEEPTYVLVPAAPAE